MKILISGANSYVGNSVEAYIKEKDKDCLIEQMDVIGDQWKEADLSAFDTIIHVAGIAHRRITKENEHLYYLVNRDLAVDIARKAKEEGVRQFIFISSMSVYNDDEIYINLETKTEPSNAYGKSKLQAEEAIRKLHDDSSFIVSVVRPPMIYGNGCKGNYNSLRKIALHTPVFPLVPNKRSMLYIENLAELLYQLANHRMGGLFLPQNKELVNTAEWVRLIGLQHGRYIRLSRFLGKVCVVFRYIPFLKSYYLKAFGDNYYEPSVSLIDGIAYQVVSFEESVRKTETN